MLLLLACTPQPPADAYEALVHQGDGVYQRLPRAIPDLVNAGRLEGLLGDATVGGRLEVDGAVLRHHAGRAPHVLYALRREGGQDVAVPLDADALVLFSFYGALGDARDALVQAGLPADPLFPVDTALDPALPDLLLAALPVDNAAYAVTAHTFVLLPDLAERDVPLAANAGVVAHELSHAVFHLVTAGSPQAPSRFTDHPEPDVIASLDEGLADLQAALVTGDPRFFDASLVLPARHLDGEATARAALDAVADDVLAELVPDPYPLGTVFASFGWDLVVAGLDREVLLEAHLLALAAWASAGEPDPWAWPDALLSALDPGWLEPGCAAAAVRFEGVATPAVCAEGGA